MGVLDIPLSLLTRNGCSLVTGGRLDVGITIPPELNFKLKFNCIAYRRTCNDLKSIRLSYSAIVKVSTCINS